MAELSARAIATLKDCRAFGYDPSDGDEEVDLWLDCLNAAASEFHNYARREFVAANAVRVDDETVTVATQTRFWDVDEWVVEERRLPIGDLSAAPTAIRVTQLDGTLVETVTLSTLIYLPRVREPWQPIGELWFRPGMTLSAALAPGYVIEVDGKWGFPALPDTLVRACANQAAVWFARDVRNFSTTFTLASDRVEVPRVLGPAIKDVVRRFRAPVEPS